MRGKLKKWTAGLMTVMMALIMIPLYSQDAYGAEAKISFSDPSAMVGNNVTVTMSITATDGALGGADVTLTYDASVLEFVGGDNASGGAGAIHLIGTMDSDNTTSFKYSLKFKTLQAGNTAVSVSNYEIYDKDVQPVTLSHVGNSNVTVTPPATYSSEASLGSLKIAPGSLSPAFSPSVTSYSANVGGDVNKIAIDAIAKDGKAKVVISGSSNLKVGENKVVCKVTAEDGQTVKTYTILVSKAEAAETTAPTESSDAGTDGGETNAAVVGDLKATVDGVEYSVASSFDESTLPEGFEVSTISYQGSEIMAGKGIEKGLTLLYLADGEGNGSFFIYGEADGSLVPFVSIDVKEKSIVILPFDEGTEVPAGLVVNDEIEVNQKNVTGWVPQGTENPEYCIFYGMNWNGEKGLYRLDRTEMTIQRYFDDSSEAAILSSPQYLKVANDFNDLVEDYDWAVRIIIGLIVVSLILLIMVINLLLKRRDRYDDGDGYGRKRRDRDEPEEDEDEEEMTPVRRRALQREREQSREERYMRGQEEPEEDFREPEQEPEPYRRQNRQEEKADFDDDFEIQDLDDLFPDEDNLTPFAGGQDKDDDFEFLDID